MTLANGITFKFCYVRISSGASSVMQTSSETSSFLLNLKIMKLKSKFPRGQIDLIGHSKGHIALLCKTMRTNIQTACKEIQDY